MSIDYPIFPENPAPALLQMKSRALEHLATSDTPSAAACRPNSHKETNALDTSAPARAPADGPAAADLPPTPKEALAALARLREEAAHEVERLLAFLDATTPDSDLEETDPLEPDGDAEPSLGWTTAIGQQGQKWAAPTDPLSIDCEEDDCDREEDDHGGGDVNDEPHGEDTDREPWLGASETGAGSQLDWAKGETFSDREDGVGPSESMIEAARKRYRPHANCLVLNGRVYDRGGGTDDLDGLAEQTNGSHLFGGAVT
jgi:hypothetical protein